MIKFAIFVVLVLCVQADPTAYVFLIYNACFIDCNSQAISSIKNRYVQISYISHTLIYLLNFSKAYSKEAEDARAAFEAASLASGNTTLASRGSLTCSNAWKCTTQRGYE